MVTPTTRNVSHHISLSDGTTTVKLILCDGRGNRSPMGIKQSGVPRTTMRISQGNGGYSDFEMPYTPLVQQDWSGGRGAADFDRDASRFFDSWRADTLRGGEITLGPKETVTSGHATSATTVSTDSTTYNDVYSGDKVATKYTPSAGIVVKKIRTKLANNTTGSSFSVRAVIFDDSAGSPGSELGSSNYMSVPFGTTPAQADFDLLAAVTLTGSTTYWIGLETRCNISGQRLYHRTAAQSGGAVKRYPSGGSAWASKLTNASLYFEIFTSGKMEAKFFEYKNMLYFASKPDDNTASKLYRNGYAGVAAANTGNLHLLKTGLTLVENELAGCVAKITAGTGADEEQNWRIITANTTGGDCTVDKNWIITHDNTTEYVILGCNKWIEISTTGLTKPVTDVCPVNGVVYFAQGEGTAIRRYRAYNNSGTWTNQFDADGTNKASLLRFIREANGNKKVWRSLNSEAKVSSAGAQSWGTNLTFGTAIECGDTTVPITGIAVYGNPEIPYILKENEFGSIASGVYAPIPMDEIRSVRSDKNGKAFLRHDVYLYFSLLDGVERYYNNHLDDIGPNRDEGMPQERSGNIARMVGYAGRFYAALDGGDDGYSSVLSYNQLGWHEIYRAQFGRRIRSLFIQPIPGKTVDRLWVSEEDDVIWLPIAVNPTKQVGYEYTSAGSVTSAWMYARLQDIVKFWKGATLFAENLSALHRTVTLEYQTDNEDETDTWHTAGTFSTSPVSTLDFSPDNDVSGRRLRYRLTLNSDDASQTPKVKAIVINSVTRIPTKNSWGLSFLLEDAQLDLNGIMTSSTPAEVIAQLKTWANSDLAPCPLTMRSENPSFDNQLVFIDPASIQPALEVVSVKKISKLIGSLTLYEA